jgi:hypothetical protein
MCLFNGSIQEVSTTKIFVSPVTDNNNVTKQVTVYSNAVKAEVETQKSFSGWLGKKDTTTFAMVLPFPVPSHLKNNVPASESHKYEANVDVIQLVDLQVFEENYGKFFDIVKDIFPQPKSNSMYFALSSSSRSAPLQVVQVGDYQASVARTFEDLNRIDQTVFKLTNNLAQVLKHKYADGFGFVICAFDPTKKVDTNSQDSHPIAYIHHLSPDGSLFVPTRHEHGHSADSQESFDHEIFSMNTNAFSQIAKSVSEESVLKNPFYSSARTALDRTMGHTLPVTKLTRKVTIKGPFKNEDLAFTIVSA